LDLHSKQQQQQPQPQELLWTGITKSDSGVAGNFNFRNSCPSSAMGGLI
jgi:hypothetical protein